MGKSPIDSTHLQHARNDRFTLLVLVVLGHAIKHIFASSFFVLLPELKVGLGLANVGVGTISTARNVVGALANIPAGFIADWLAGYRAVIIGGTLVFLGLFHFMLGSSSGFWMAVLASTLIGATITFYHPAAISSLSRRFIERRGFAIALHGTGGQIGEAVGPALVGLLLLVLTWRELLQVSLIPALLCGGLIWWFLRAIPVEAERAPGIKTYMRSVLSLIANRRLLMILIISGGFGAAQSSIMTFLPIFIREDMGLSSLKVGLYIALTNVAGIGTQPLMGYLSDKIGRGAVLAPGFLFLGIGVFSLSVLPAGVPFTIGVFVMGAFCFPMMSILIASAMDVVGQDVQGATVSLVYGFGIVFSGVSPTVAGYIADTYGVESVFLYASVLALATAAISIASVPFRHS